MKQDDLIYDWNRLPGCYDYSSVDVELDDETLRDGLQNPSVTDPPVEKKVELLHRMVDLGIHSADIGLPGAGPRAYKAVLALAHEIVQMLERDRSLERRLGFAASLILGIVLFGFKAG